MFKKALACALLAAGVLIVPSAAFADQQQSQKNVQTTDQNGAAVNHSVSTQSGDSINIQQQIQKQNRYGKSRYYCPKSSTNQAQRSTQITRQSSAATNSSVSVQGSSTTSNKNQIALGNTGCYYRF